MVRTSHQLHSAKPGFGDDQLRQAIGLIADKWTVMVVHTLAQGTRRYSELQRAIGGVSQKVLTQNLRTLERNGLVERVVHPVVPPRVEYSLTPLGETLTDLLGALCTWAEDHFAEVEAARARYDDADRA